jgi:PhzF family phenazine biosynthesis protein
MKHPLFLVDAFTDHAFAGNPAAVVLDCADVESPTLQKIAAELRQSETAFPLPARDPQCAFHLRWFTPVGELAFCGHGTLAALYVLVEEAKRVRVAEQGVTRLAFTCKAGKIRVELWRAEQGRLRIQFETPPCAFENVQIGGDLVNALGLVSEALDPNFPPQRNPRVGTDLHNLFVAVRDRETLSRARPDFAALGALQKERKLGGVTLYALNPEPGVDAALRYFNPAMGNPEDAVTGSACGQLGVLIQTKLPAEMPRKLELAQGRELGRPGKVRVEIRPESEPGQVRAWVGGELAPLVRGELDLPKVKR